jgi:prophage regulatory protein
MSTQTREHAITPRESARRARQSAQDQAARAALLRYVSPRELIGLTGLSEATIYRLIARGDLPRPIRLSPGRTAWREDVIAAWLEARA